MFFLYILLCSVFYKVGRIYVWLSVSQSVNQSVSQSHGIIRISGFIEKKERTKEYFD
jgi:hypothetical protein